MNQCNAPARGGQVFFFLYISLYAGHLINNEQQQQQQKWNVHTFAHASYTILTGIT